MGFKKIFESPPDICVVWWNLLLLEYYICQGCPAGPVFTSQAQWPSQQSQVWLQLDSFIPLPPGPDTSHQPHQDNPHPHAICEMCECILSRARARV